MDGTAIELAAKDHDVPGPGPVGRQAVTSDDPPGLRGLAGAVQAATLAHRRRPGDAGAWLALGLARLRLQVAALDRVPPPARGGSRASALRAMMD
jgi:hypothetical protein